MNDPNTKKLTFHVNLGIKRTFTLQTQLAIFVRTYVGEIDRYRYKLPWSHKRQNGNKRHGLNLSKDGMCELVKSCCAWVS